jgi:hypothetical protein
MPTVNENSTELLRSYSLNVRFEPALSLLSLYPRIAHRSTMEAALTLCGFNAATAQYLIDQGFNTPEALLLATEADLDTIARNVTRTPPRVEGGGTVTMPFIALKHLKGFRFWADECKRTGFDPDPDTFAEEDVTSYTEKYLEYTAQKDAAKDEDPSKPEALKKLTSWALWNESFQNYLRQILGAAKIPLVYLTREESDAGDDIDPKTYGSSLEYLIDATIFEGRHYELDNPRFYRELKSFTVNGEGWSYIKRFEKQQDGRKAYLALRSQCEGTASKITRKNRAYASISNALYNGQRRQYRFQDYINVHQAAHNEILDCDPTEAVPESKKVSDFLKGITDPKLESAVSVVLGDPKLLNDFQACQQYLSTTVENRATLEKSKERNISGVTKGDEGSGGGKKEKKKLPKNFKLENKYYPPGVYRLLSDEQRKQLKKWQEEKAGGGKRSVAAIKKQIKEELKSEAKKGKNKGKDNEESDAESSADEAAGKEFGRGAHKSKKQKS